MKKLLITSALFLSAFQTVNADLTRDEKPKPSQDLQEKIQDMLPDVVFLQKIYDMKVKYYNLIEFDYKLNQSEKSKYYNMAVSYGQAGMKELDEAEQITWYIPDANIKECLQIAVKSAIESIGSGGNWKLALNTVSNIVLEFAPKILEQYNELKTHLSRAEYYFEMSEFYLNIAKNA